MAAIISPTPAEYREILNAFFPLCTEGKIKCNMIPGHSDGWGISGFNAGRAVYFERRAEPASESRDLYAKAIQRLEAAPSPVVIAHLRKASAGSRSLVNTHPFHYRDWVFAHNGTVFNANTLPLIEAKPLGTTDSERLGSWLIDHVRNAMDPTQAIVQQLKEWRSHLIYSSLTFLLSDGQQLWAYREVGEKGLEPGENQDDRYKYYTLYWTLLNKSVIVCSEPLQGISPNWKALQDKQLLAFTTDSLSPKAFQL